MEIVTLLVVSLGSIATAASAILIYLQLKSTHDWNRRKSSQEVLDSLTTGEFPKALSRLRLIVKDKLGIDMQNDSKDYNDLKHLCNAQEIRAVTGEVILLLNTMETISVYVKNSIVDEDICYNFSYTFFIDLYHFLKPYIYECRQRESNEFVFAEYEYYALRWEARLLLEKQQTLKTKATIVQPKRKL